jgi:hypothetical protein
MTASNLRLCQLLIANLRLCQVQDAERNWHFDIFSFAEATEGHTLSTMTFYLMKRGGAMTKFGMHEASLCSYLQALEAGYNPLPYHNA